MRVCSVVEVQLMVLNVVFHKRLTKARAGEGSHSHVVRCLGTHAAKI